MCFNREAWEIEFEVIVDPKGKIVAIINSDMIVCDEEIPVLLDKGLIGLKELDGVI